MSTGPVAGVIRYLGYIVPVGWVPDRPGHCRSCGAEVLWAITPKGATAPLNPDGVSHFATCPQAAEWRQRKQGGTNAQGKR